MQLLYPSHPEESAKIFPILMNGFFGISATYVFGTLLTANGSLKKLNIIAGCGMLISFLLNLILVPRLMAVGSAYASLISQIITAIVQIIVVVKIFKFKINYKYLASLIIYVAGVLMFAKFSHLIHKNWLINIFFLIGASLILAFVLKLINLKSLFKIFKEG